MYKVAIHGAPRSGTTWLANIFNSHESVAYRQQPLFSYAFKGFLDENSSSKHINLFFENILNSQDQYLRQTKELADGKIPLFQKNEPSHIVYKEVRYHFVLENLLAKSDAHIIAIIRNPLAVINSFFNAPAEFKADWNKDEEWQYARKKNQEAKENYFGFEKWKETASLFHNLQLRFGSERVSIVKYEDLLLNTLKVSAYLFEKVGLDFSKQTEDFIQLSKSSSDKSAYSVFKEKNHDLSYIEELNENIINAVSKDLKSSPFEIYLPSNY